ncbi:MAG: aminotransferase class I/II-fold pyridoxal phosphate-dependent enzyme [Firmicutes bacterium]|nr:aminotransferase class I/II-fold pyridoxal phosphate-dependent enzyme [Bacillota bacterium]
MDLFSKLKMPPLVDQIREAGVYPYFHELQSRQDTTVIMEGKRRIMLGSNNYLGLTVNEEVCQAAHDALERYGTGCSGSRFLNGTLDLHLELERQLAEFVGKEAAMTTSTGYQTNLAAIASLIGPHDYTICDIENHASIYDACKMSYGKMLRYKHSDMEDLERKLQKVPENAGILIITDGVFSMSGDIARLPEIVALAEKYQARVMVDDAHGLGVIGEGGRGTASYFGLTDKVDIIMSTFSKSFASLGGCIAARAEIIDFLRHSARPFIFSASMPPACTAATLAALKVIREHPELPQHLLDLADYMRKGLTKRGIEIRESTAPIIPIYTYDAMRTLTLNRRLYEEGVYVNCVLPPATSPDACLLRTSLMASHTEELLDEAMDIIARVVKE